jgi:hypothetical protein
MKRRRYIWTSLAVAGRQPEGWIERLTALIQKAKEQINAGAYAELERLTEMKP